MCAKQNRNKQTYEMLLRYNVRCLRGQDPGKRRTIAQWVSPDGNLGQPGVTQWRFQAGLKISIASRYVTKIYANMALLPFVPCGFGLLCC